jgi:SMC interacting uncharacterized protein involved in chromosome segregation
MTNELKCPSTPYEYVEEYGSLYSENERFGFLLDIYGDPMDSDTARMILHRVNSFEELEADRRMYMLRCEELGSDVTRFQQILPMEKQEWQRKWYGMQRDLDRLTYEKDKYVENKTASLRGYIAKLSGEYHAELELRKAAQECIDDLRAEIARLRKALRRPDEKE